MGRRLSSFPAARVEEPLARVLLRVLAEGRRPSEGRTGRGLSRRSDGVGVVAGREVSHLFRPLALVRLAEEEQQARRAVHPPTPSTLSSRHSTLSWRGIQVCACSRALHRMSNGLDRTTYRPKRPAGLLAALSLLTTTHRAPWTHTTPGTRPTRPPEDSTPPRPLSVPQGPNTLTSQPKPTRTKRRLRQ